MRYQNKIIVTTKFLAQAYGVSENLIRVNFHRNKQRFIMEKHFFKVTGAEKEHILSLLPPVMSKETNKYDRAPLYLWTEKGALLHAKAVDTDKAWDVYDQLIDQYFEKEQLLLERELTEHHKTLKDTRTLLIEMRESDITMDDASIAFKMLIAARDGSKIDAKTLLLITEAMQKDE